MVALSTLAPVRRPRPGPRTRGRSAVRAVFLIALLALVLYPLVWLLVTSFKSTSEIPSNMSLIPKAATLQNYVRGWTGLQTVSFAASSSTAR
jgi:multiple sugar transport system permease protein